jgi:hypothetical protein
MLLNTKIVDVTNPINWQSPLNKGLVSWWLNLPNAGWRGGKKLYDLVRGGRKPNDATILGNTSWVRGGRPGGYGALNFNRSTSLDCVDCGNPTILQTGDIDFSVSGWVKKFGEPGTLMIAIKGADAGAVHEWSIFFFGGSIYFRVQNGAASVNVGSSLLDNVWYHFVASHDAVNDNISITLNGTTRVTTSYSGGITVSSDTVKLATDSGQSGGRMLDGQLDDIRFYRTALGSAEVYALYEQSRRGYPDILNFIPSNSIYLTEIEPTTYFERSELKQVDSTFPVNWQSPLNKGLVSWWLNLPNSGKRGGSTFRDLCNRNHGTLVNGPTWISSDRPGGCGALSFDGVDDYVEVLSPVGLPDIDGTMSVSFWCKHNAGAAGGVGGGTAFSLIKDNSSSANNTIAVIFNNRFSVGHLVVDEWGSAVHRAEAYLDSPNGNWPDDTWGLFTYTCGVGGAGGKIYYNGRDITLSAATSAQSGAIGVIRIGSFNAAYPTPYYNRPIDDVRIFNRALNPSEVNAIYQDSKTKYKNTLNFTPTSSVYVREIEPVTYFGTGNDISRYVDSVSPINWQSPLNKGLYGWWKLIPNSGYKGGLSFRDLCGRNHGSLVNNPTISQGIKPNDFGAVSVSGGSGIKLPFPAIGTEDITFVITLYIRSLLGEYNALWDSSIRQWSLFVDNTTTPNFGSGGPTALAATIGGSNIQLNTWTQIVGTRIGGTIEIGYLNGKQSGTYLSATPSVTATDVYFGPNPTGGGTAFDGCYSEIRLHVGVAWSSGEVEAYYKDSLRGYRDTLNWINSPSFFTKQISIGNQVNNYYTSLWNIRALVNNNAQILWSLHSLISKANIYIWNVLDTVHVGIGYNLLWNTRAVSGDNLALIYNVLLSIGDARQLLYNVRKVVTAPELDILYNIALLVHNANSLKWDVGQLINNVVVYLWNTHSTVLQQRSALWNLRDAVLQNKTVLWNLKQLVLKDIDNIWDVYKVITSNRSLVWNVVSITSALNDIAILWKLRSTVLGQSELFWNERELVNYTRQLLWNIHSNVSQEREVLWNTRHTILNTNTILWQVESIVGAIRNVNLTWNVRQIVELDSVYRWDVRQRLSPSLLTQQWNVKSKVGLPVTLLWKDYALSGNTIRSIWELRSLVRKEPILIWNVKLKTGIGVIVYWRLNSLSRSNRRFLWNTLGAPVIINNITEFDMYVQTSYEVF